MIADVVSAILASAGAVGIFCLGRATGNRQPDKELLLWLQHIHRRSLRKSKGDADMNEIRAMAHDAIAGAKAPPVFWRTPSEY